MIVSNLTIGLGNQLFQYARGFSLSRERGVPFAVDVYSPIGCGERHFEIQAFFEISAAPAQRQQLRSQCLFFRLPAPVQRRLRWNKRMMNVFRRHILTEPGFAHCPDPAPLRSNLYLLGYWQSPRYFATAEADLRNEFKFKRPLSSEGSRLREKIEQSNSVSLHVRRGDYLSKGANELHGVCELDYYGSAISYLQSHLGTCEFFVFSDDIEWARQNLKFPSKAHFVSHTTGSTADEDLRLMSLCKHSVIANSTFSWWGAWLNANKERIVIAPKLWFRDEKMNAEARSLYPDYWVQL